MAGPGWQVEALNLKKEIKSNIYVKQLLSPNLNQIKEGGSGMCRDVSLLISSLSHLLHVATSSEIRQLTIFVPKRTGLQPRFTDKSTACHPY